jgi:hypothetical protein
MIQKKGFTFIQVHMYIMLHRKLVLMIGRFYTTGNNFCLKTSKSSLFVYNYLFVYTSRLIKSLNLAFMMCFRGILFELFNTFA